MRTLLRFILSVFLMTLSLVSGAWPATAPSGRSVVGKVFLGEGTQTPGDYVMVYFPALGTGTMSDERGNISMTLPKGSPNVLKVEYSRIGYETVQKTVTISGDVTDLGTVNMKVQTLMLTAAYVVPDGMSAPEFILSKLWEKTLQNRKKKLTYGADISYDFATHELPLVASVMPKGKLGLAKFAAGLMGYGPLINYCLKNDDISASASLSRTVAKGKANDYNEKIIRSNPSPLPGAVQREIIKVFHNIDLFELAYGQGSEWGQKFAKSHKFRLVGTYEYGDKLVDVLSWTGKERVTINLHIVEQEWGILKFQCVTREGEVIRCECRDMGDGVYMPLSFVMKPSISMVRPDQIPMVIEEVGKTESLNKAAKERILNLLQDRLDKNQSFNPYLTCSFNVRYR